MTTLKTLAHQDSMLKVLSNFLSVIKMFYYYYFEQDSFSTQNFGSNFTLQIDFCRHSIRFILKHFNRSAMRIDSLTFVRLGHCKRIGQFSLFCLSIYSIYLFIFYLGFLSQTFTIHRTAGERGCYLFNFSLPLSLASRTLRLLGDY